MSKMKTTTLLLCLLANGGHAQKSEADLEQSHSIEKVEVTGSLIKRTDMEGPSPVQTFDKDYIEKAGHNSVSDILRETTANSFGSMRERSGSNAAGVGQVNLRGLGATRTLVLMNGQRLAKDGVTGAPDLNLIPVSAIERIDILKDGGSATYGSDALGGVVNIITKKNWDGTEFNVRHEQPEEPGGAKSTVSMSHGYSSNKLNVITSIQGRKNSILFDRDRDWTSQGESIFAPYANYTTENNGSFASPDCPANAPRNEAGLCVYNFSQDSSRQPELNQVNALVDANYQLNANTEVGLMVSGTYKEANWNYAPGANTLVLQGDFIDDRNLPGHNPGESVLVRWRSKAAGNRDTEVTTTSYRIAPKLTRYLSDTWEMQATAGTEFVKRKDISTNGYMYSEKLTQAVKDGVIDPFSNTGNIPEDLRYDPYEIVSSRVSFAETRFSGELFNLPAGPTAMAIGVGYSYESFSDRVDPLSIEGGVAGGGSGSNGEGKREVQYAFTEFAVPLASKLEMQVSGRFDHYSDFGDTVNPKAAVKYRPTNWLMLRASAGTGFKAPDMTDLYSAGSESHETFVDKVACSNGVPGACSPSQYTVMMGGNSNLKEEKSTSFNLGMLIEPNKNFNIGIDLWQIELNNVVGINFEGITEAEQNGVDLSQYNTSVERNSDGTIRQIDTQLQNLSKRKLNGVDLSMSINHDTEILGFFRYTNNLSYLFNYEESGFPGTPYQEQLKTNGSPQWRNNFGVEYIPNDKILVAINLLTTGKSEKSVEGAGYLDEYTQVDAQVNYALSSLDGTIGIGAKNILGSTPPLDDSNINRQLNEELYDPVGRRFFVSYKQLF